MWVKPWYTEREEKIMVNRVLRDDPAKGLSPMQMKLKWADVRKAWSHPHLWLLVFIGLVACEFDLSWNDSSPSYLVC
jgi:hypothetical protein